MSQMYVYVTAPTEWTKNNKELFRSILDVLSNLSYKNTNEYINAQLNNLPNPDENKKNFHTRTRKRIKKADLLVADISLPSVTVGTLIEYAISNNIPVLCLCNEEYKKDVPSVIKYYDSRLFTLLLYDKNDIEELLKNYLGNFTKGKIKFNAFLSPDLDSYLKWYSVKYRISKSDFVRDLILEKIKNDKEFSKTLPNNS